MKDICWIVLKVQLCTVCCATIYFFVNFNPVNTNSYIFHIFNLWIYGGGDNTLTHSFLLISWNFNQSLIKVFSAYLSEFTVTISWYLCSTSCTWSVTVKCFKHGESLVPVSGYKQLTFHLIACYSVVLSYQDRLVIFVTIGAGVVLW